MKNFDESKFSATVNSIIQNPNSGVLPFHAKLNWQKDGLLSHVSIRDFSPLKIDEPFELGGKNRAPNPVEYVITGVVACFSLVVLIKSHLEGIEIHSLETEIDTNLDMGTFFSAVAGGRHGFGDVTITLHIDTDASKQKIEEIAQYALKYSPSVNSINVPLRIIVDKK